MARKKIVHCGLFGHVDSGKTAIASCLSEVISTAGLDAHPQSKNRGISIDLGFTSFDIRDYKIALVDAPGHADLIRSVVASANIIDVALLVIDAMKGPEIQTGEHMVILEVMGIKNVIIVMNKVDLVPTASELKEKIDRLRGFLAKSGTMFAGAPIVQVSAKTRQGIGELISTLDSCLERYESTQSDLPPFIMPFDHHFQVKGFGTVLTGTITSGTVKVGDVLEISPLGMSGKVKSINIFKKSYDEARAGDRAGIALTGIDNSKLYRGCIACTPNSLKKSKNFMISGSMIRFFKHNLNFKSQVHVTVGMLTVPAIIYPFKKIDDSKVMVNSLAPPKGGV
ncbi:MAG: selenocysteine-specific translation elongation factor, partial [Promethearchaeota archaeon]